MPVAPAVARRLRVAVRTQDLEILQSVIAIVSVDVVESPVQRLAAPLGYSTELTPVPLRPSSISRLLRLWRLRFVPL